MTTNRYWRDFDHSHFKPHIIGGPGLQPGQQPPNVPELTEAQLERGMQRILTALRNCKCKSEDETCTYCTGEWLDSENN